MSWDFFEKQFPQIAEPLKKARSTGRLAHAYLIYADSAEARDLISLALGQLAVCINPRKDHAPCGECSHCLAIQKGSYAELYRLAPSSKTRQIKIGEDKEDVDTMRWFEDKFYYTSSIQNCFKVGIIQDAECMNEPAQNAFLKTLEEPPEQTLILLVTGQPSRLLPTIRSRCQILTLLTHQVTYNQSFVDPLIETLKHLQIDPLTQSNLLEIGETAAVQLTEISKGLKKEAEATMELKWSEKFTQMKDYDLSASEKKRFDQKFDAAVQAEYLMLRESFLNIIRDWFSVGYEISLKIPRESLSFQFMVSRIPQQVDQISEKIAQKHLAQVDELLNNLRFNVNEESAFRCFCLSIAFADQL